MRPATGPIGAYTNLALLEERSPGILRQAKLFLMGGYLFPPRIGFPTWGNEFDWNVQVDVRSAYTVLRAADHPTLIPLSVTVETVLRRAYLPSLRGAGPLAHLIAHQAEPFAEDEGIEAKWGQTCAALPDDTINFQHDPLACAIALGWRAGVEIRQFPLQVAIKDGWLVESIVERGQPAHVVTQIDGPKFSEFWLDMVCR
jgi:purine nucleosidase